MKARIICNGLNDVRDKVRELCDTSDVRKVYLPSNTKNNNHYGIAYAVDFLNNVIAATPYWKTDDGKYELQADLTCLPQLCFRGE